MTDTSDIATQTPISLDTAVIVTGRSKRTWHRRIIEGSAVKLESDDGRTMISLADVLPSLVIDMGDEDVEYLVRADGGDAEAQDDMGNLFSAAGKPAAAVYWFELAAQQECPNAMQNLSRCYLACEGVEKNEHTAVMWLAKAAAHGHVIAQHQMRALGIGS